MKINQLQRYDSVDSFYSLGGSVVMKLSTDAAIAVCETATAHGLSIARIEGGLWHNPGFEAMIDCIWDGISHVTDQKLMERNNQEAAEFIRSERAEHDVFILTTLK